MKVRHGFVSNSSSSSFVVRVFSEYEKMWLELSPSKSRKSYATDKEIQLLLAAGFKPSSVIRDSNAAYEIDNRLHPMWLESCKTKDRGKNPFWHQSKVDKHTESLVFSVDCNQGVIIKMLVQKNIPFTAACHYGNETVCFKRDGKVVINMVNTGLATEMYGGATLYGKKMVRKISVKKILEEE